MKAVPPIFERLMTDKTDFIIVYTTLELGGFNWHISLPWTGKKQNVVPLSPQ
jgi:hypothetical protein